jgi:hypothetical protein
MLQAWQTRFTAKINAYNDVLEMAREQEARLSAEAVNFLALATWVLKGRQGKLPTDCQAASTREFESYDTFQLGLPGLVKEGNVEWVTIYLHWGANAVEKIELRISAGHKFTDRFAHPDRDYQVPDKYVFTLAIKDMKLDCAAIGKKLTPKQTSIAKEFLEECRQGVEAIREYEASFGPQTFSFRSL